MLALAVIAEPLAVIADHDERGRAAAGRDVILETLHKTPELLVHRRDLSQVRPIGEPGAKRLGGRIRRVGIEVVHPQKHGLVSRRAEGGQRAIGRVLRSALHAPGRQLVVVDIEAAREPETARQHEGRHERARPIPRGFQSLRQDGMAGRQEPRVLVNAVTGGIQAGHHRAVRRQGLGHRGIRLTESPPARGQGVECRRADALRVRTDRVGARRIERDEQDRRLRSRRSRLLRALAASPASCRDARGCEHDSGDLDAG